VSWCRINVVIFEVDVFTEVVWSEEGVEHLEMFNRSQCLPLVLWNPIQITEVWKALKRRVMDERML
jgi:hypothetical protein